jgi:hypothetical protein
MLLPLMRIAADNTEVPQGIITNILDGIVFVADVPVDGTTTVIEAAADGVVTISETATAETVATATTSTAGVATTTATTATASALSVKAIAGIAAAIIVAAGVTTAVILGAFGGNDDFEPAPRNPDRAEPVIVDVPVETDVSDIADTSEISDVSDSSEPILALSNVSTGDIIQFGDFDWRVLDVQDDRMLVLSERILERLVYNSTATDITWETSDIRAYLNSSFLNSFSMADRERIIPTVIINNDNHWFDDGGIGGNDTEDYFFLLSFEDVITYFGYSGQEPRRIAGGTTRINDRYNSERIAYCVDLTCCTIEIIENPLLRNSCGWWLRSPGLGNEEAGYINNNGTIGVAGSFVDFDMGIRPAMWLDLDTGELW